MNIFELSETVAVDRDLFSSTAATLPQQASRQAPAMLTPAHLPNEVCYPYLCAAFPLETNDGYAERAQHMPFTRRSWSLKESEQIAQAKTLDPTLRYVKDNAIVDIDIAGMTEQHFLSHFVLKTSTEKGLFVLGKRLSRILRPFRYFAFFDAAMVNVVCDARHDGDSAWDGMSLVSPAFVRRMACSGQWQAQYPDEHECHLKRRELLAATRLELTMMTADGQIKGHALVVDGLPAGVDVVTNDQNIKSELSQHNGKTFVGLEVVHGKASADIDKQSLINLTPFLDHTWLLDNLRQETDAQLEELAQVTRQEPRASRPKASVLEQFIDAGGDPNAYLGIRRMQYRGRLEQLTYYSYPDLRLPGFQRYYICTDANVGLEIPQGTVMVRPEWDSVVVNAQDWREYIADVLGGADMDDAVLIHQFLDKADGTVGMVIWRQPNQSGEYVRLEPLPEYEMGELVIPALPHNDSRLLPPRIDTQSEPLPTDGAVGYGGNSAELPTTLAATIDAAVSNYGVLGMYCNLLMVAVAVYGRSPKTAPIRLEAIIDATVKTGADVGWVKQWITQAAVKLVNDRAIPEYLVSKVYGLLADLPAAQRPRIRKQRGHWIDQTHSQIGMHVTAYKAKMDAALAQVSPLLELLALGREDVAGVGQRLHAIYEMAYQGAYTKAMDELMNGSTKNQNHQLAHEVANRFAKRKLNEAITDNDLSQSLRFILAYAYTFGKSDRAVWTPEFAPQTIAALAETNLLASDDAGQQTAISATIHHVWYNLKYANLSVANRPKMCAINRRHSDIKRLSTVAQQVPLIDIIDGRCVHSTRTGLLMGLLPKRSPLPNGRYAIKLALPTPEGSLRVWLQAVLTN